MLCCAASADERQAVDEMKVLCGLTSDADLIRTALWNLSEHLHMKIDLRLGVFDLRPRHGWKNARNGKQPKQPELPAVGE